MEGWGVYTTDDFCGDWCYPARERDFLADLREELLIEFLRKGATHAMLLLAVDNVHRHPKKMSADRDRDWQKTIPVLLTKKYLVLFFFVTILFYLLCFLFDFVSFLILIPSPPPPRFGVSVVCVISIFFSSCGVMIPLFITCSFFVSL